MPKMPKLPLSLLLATVYNYYEAGIVLNQGMITAYLGSYLEVRWTSRIFYRKYNYDLYLSPFTIITSYWKRCNDALIVTIKI